MANTTYDVVGGMKPSLRKLKDLEIGAIVRASLI
jgi:hypothetical protein